MAYRRSASRSRRSAPRRSAPRRSYRSRAVSRGRRSTSRRASGGARTIRIEVVSAQPSQIARPDTIAMKAAEPLRKAKF